MVAFLPEAIVCYPLIICTSKAETIEHPCATTLMFVFLQFLKNLFVCELLEVAQNVANRLFSLSANHHVQMIRHQYPRINPQPFLLLTIL